MNTAYLVPDAAIQAGLPVRGEWHGHTIPGDPQRRWLVLVNHVDDADEQALVATAGVTPLPALLASDPLPAAAVTLLGRFGVTLTAADTIGSALLKLRAVWPKAAAMWR